MLKVVCEKALFGGMTLGKCPEGKSVLVRFAIPGETVLASVVQQRAGMRIAEVERVLEASPHRQDVVMPGAYSHVRYEHQLRLKADIVNDAMKRIGGVTLSGDVAVRPSPFEGHRMRARLHVAVDGSVGFLVPRTHEVDDGIESLSALLPATRELLAELPPLPPGQMTLLENAKATMRALHIHGQLGDGAVSFGAGWSAVTHGRSWQLCHGSEAAVHDEDERMLRSAPNFYQCNRFLADQLASFVAAELPSRGSVLDLYAGGGLFSAAALKARPSLCVTAVESHNSDLPGNGRRVGFATRQLSCEEYLAGRGIERVEAAIVDPPRAGCSAAVLEGVARLADRLVYVSCDPATLARDCKLLGQRGFAMVSCEAFDMFPYSQHIETVTVLAK